MFGEMKSQSLFLSLQLSIVHNYKNGKVNLGEALEFEIQ